MKYSRFHSKLFTQFARKTATFQDKFLDPVNLVLTATLYAFNSQCYQQSDGVAMRERFVEDVYSILKHTNLKSHFHHINNLDQKFTMDEKSNEELAFLDTLLKRNIEKFMCCYIGSLHILTNTYTTALTTKQVATEMLLPPYLIEHIPLPQIKMSYTKKILK